MPIFSDGYHTAAGALRNVERTKTAITECLIKDPLISASLDVRASGDTRPVFITGLYDSEVNIPLFTHPLYMKTRNEVVLATDLRLYIRKDNLKENQSLANVENFVRNRTEFNFAKSRAILNLAWVDGLYEDLKIELEFAGFVYSRWLADVIARNYALSPMDKHLVSVVASYYWHTLFQPESVEVDDETLEKWSGHTIKATGADATLVNEVFQKLKAVRSLDDFAAAISSTLQSVRLDKFSVVSLYTLIANTWYGTNAREIVGVAIQLPPTFMAIVYTALSERTYKNSLIARMAEDLGKRGRADVFVQNYRNIVARYKVTPAHLALLSEQML